MLKIFNELKPFMEDVYREHSVREYAKLVKVSAPTASTILHQFEKEGILTRRAQGVYIFFRANRESLLFKDLAAAYWRYALNIAFKPVHDLFLFKKIILFGSIAKAENKSDSDIDLFADSQKKEINLSQIESKLKRKVQIHFKDALKNTHLKKSIERGIEIISKTRLAGTNAEIKSLQRRYPLTKICPFL